MTTAGIEQVVAELRSRERFLLTAHEGPDGDALGSLLGMHHLLGQLGKDSVMFMAAKEFPLPIEYRFLPLEEVFHEPPADMADRTVIFLDCGNIDRMPVEFLSEGDNFRINIDHHHDNTRFGDVNLVEIGASSTAEIVYELAIALGAEITPEIASALYVGLITDTGKFMYENTNAHTHRIAAELIDAGVAVDDTYRRLYEHVPIEKLRLLSRALDGIQRYCGERLVVSYITAADYEASGGGEEMTEGIIDHLRSIEGSQGGGADPRPGRSRPRRAQGQPALQRRRDRRLGDGARARGRGAQAGRRLLHRPRARRAGQLPLRRSQSPARPLSMAAAGAGSVLLCDKPAGKTSHDVVLAVRRERRGEKVGHAGTLDPFATGLLLVLIGRATRLQRFLVELPKTYVARGPARLALEHRRSRRRADARPDACPDSLELPTGTVRQRVPMTSAVRVGGERLYRKAHRGEVVETPEREVEVYRAELLGSDAESAEYEIECSAGTYIRTLIETLDDAYCAELRRTAIGPFRIEDAGRELSLDQVRRAGPGDRRGPTMSSGGLFAYAHKAHRKGLLSIQVTSCPTPSRARATSRSAPSTASTAATRP